MKVLWLSVIATRSTSTEPVPLTSSPAPGPVDPP
jgi:hypothetical protein